MNKMNTTAAPYKAPNLPGFTYYDPSIEDHRRGQYLKVTAGLMGTRPPTMGNVTKQIGEHSQKLSLMEPSMRLSETFAQTRGVDIEAPPVYDPVLRFYGYFRESIPESPDEEQRVRYVRMEVFMEDDTVQVQEYRIRNAGMEQGVLLRRMRVMNPSAKPYGTQYTNMDFMVGITMEICGICYRIYACDAFTEKYFQENCRDVGRFEDPPDDLYSIKRRLTERPIRVTKINTDKKGLRQFLDFDGKVLRFYSIWDDSHSMFGEKRKFLIHYFLVDDTIEVRNMHPANSGRDQVSQFLSRVKLMSSALGRPYNDGDLRVGTHLNINGRDFLLYDADDFTKQFIDQKYGPQNWTPVDIGERAAQARPERELPPHNGWGDEEDSKGYCLSLHPAPPKKNVIKMIGRDGQVLRFTAQMKNPAPQDRARKFVVAFYLADDTVAVFELPQRNSGFREGKFIQRSRMRNVDAGNRYFIPADFEVGKEVTVNGFVFITGEADEYAMNLMEAESDEYPQSDLNHIIEFMRRDRDNVQKIKGIFAFDDKKKIGYVDAKSAESLIMKMFGIHQHEAVTIVRRWVDGWGFNYEQFLSTIA